MSSFYGVYLVTALHGANTSAAAAAGRCLTGTQAQGSVLVGKPWHVTFHMLGFCALHTEPSTLYTHRRPNVNLISGENGSGKSAILQGLQCCLGVKAQETGRCASHSPTSPREGQPQPHLIFRRAASVSPHPQKSSLWGSQPSPLPPRFCVLLLQLWVLKRRAGERG